MKQKIPSIHVNLGLLTECNIQTTTRGNKWTDATFDLEFHITEKYGNYDSLQ